MSQDELISTADSHFAPRQEPEPLDLSSGRFLNEQAVRNHALACSKAYRAGRFTRVGEEFLDEVKADAEALVRELRKKYPTLHGAIEPGENKVVTGLLLDKVEAELNRAICRIIQNKVQKQPSCGVTLGRTR